MARTRNYKFRSETTHNFERHPELEGQILRFDYLKVGKEKRKYAVIDTGEATTMVFESKALEAVFEQGLAGDFVNIEFHGKKALAGGKHFNKFSVQLWSEKDDGQAETET